MPRIKGAFKRAFKINYETPWLTNAIAAIFLHYIATGQSIYQMNKMIEIPVKEKIGGDDVIIEYLYEESPHSAFPMVRCARNISFLRRLLDGARIMGGML